MWRERHGSNSIKFSQTGLQTSSIAIRNLSITMASMRRIPSKNCNTRDKNCSFSGVLSFPLKLII